MADSPKRDFRASSWPDTSGSRRGIYQRLWPWRGETPTVAWRPRIAANVFGLDFLPLLAERYKLVIPEQRLDLPSVQALLDVLQRRSLRRELEALGGYDTAATGSEVCG
jgi:hypothetical protein